MKENGYVTVIVVAIVAVVLICVLGITIYFEFVYDPFNYKLETSLPINTRTSPSSSQAVPSPIQATSPAQTDETANWKTYTNNELKFSLRYPSNWEQSNQETIRDETQFKGVGLIIDKKEGGGYYCGLVINWGNYYSEGFAKQYNFDEWIADRKTQIENGSQLENLKLTEQNITLDKNSGTKLTYSGHSFLGDVSFWEIYVPFQTKILFIRQENPVVANNECNPLYSQILSTFKSL